MRTRADHDAERAFIGAIADVSTSSPDRARQLLESTGLQPVDFDLALHQRVLGVAVELLRAGSSVEYLSVQPKVEGTSEELVALLMPTLSFENSIPALAKTISDLAWRRRVMDMMRRAAEKLNDSDTPVDEAHAWLAREIDRIAYRHRQVRDFGEALTEVSNELAETMAGKHDPVLRSGIAELDTAIGGFPNNLTVIGASPGVGKSALLTTVIEQVATSGKTVGLLSLEDPATSFAYRMVANRSGIGNFILRTRRLTDGQFERVHNAIGELWTLGPKIVFEDRNGLSSREVVAVARDMIINRGANIIVLDHLGEIRLPRNNGERRDLDMAEVLSDLRGIAKAYRVPVVCATHLTRMAGKKPTLGDFAHGAAVERMARVALALTREDANVTVHVLKQTNGKGDIQFNLELIEAAAMMRAGRTAPVQEGLL